MTPVLARLFYTLERRVRARGLQPGCALVGRVPSCGAGLAFPSECELSRPGQPEIATLILPERWDGLQSRMVECSDSRANPEGWQRVAGGRPRQRGERPPEKRVSWSSTPEGCQTAGAWTTTAASISVCVGESGTPAGVLVISGEIVRRSPPAKPSATSGYPLPTLRVERPSGLPLPSL